MKTKMLRIVLLAAMLFGLLMPVSSVQARTADAAPVQAKGLSPAGLLNQDGTLNLSGGFNGSLDLSGYSVQMDPKRGPVFGPAQSGSSAPAAAAPSGQWTGVGAGGGAIDGGVYDILVNGADVYVAGSFTDAASIPEADYIAKWDGSHWSALGDDGVGDGALSNDVSGMVLVGTDLYVGGYFGQVYNHSRTAVSGAQYIAKWDGTNWSAVGSDGAGGGSLNRYVTAITASGSNVFVAGGFTNVNNGGTTLNAADYVAKWDGTNWSALGSNGADDGSLGNNPYIAAIVASGSNLYIGGQFHDMNNNGVVVNEADNVAKWDGANWSALGSNGSGNGSIAGTVFVLAVSGSDLYVGGQFNNVNNNGAVLNAGDWIVKWNETSGNWSALGSNGANDGALDNYASALWVNGTDVYVGGNFTNVNNNGLVLDEADYLAKWDGSNWSAIGNNGLGNGSISGKPGAGISALAMQGGNLLMGGWFYDLNNGGTILPQADYLAQWNGSNWSSIGSDSNGALANGYASSGVYAVLVAGTDIYVGGRFIDVSNHGVNIPEADYIAKWDGADWSALGSDGAGDGSLRYNVYALAMDGSGNLYVGGQFTNVNDNGTVLDAADYVAKWDGVHWSALGSDGAGNGAIPSSSYAVVSSLAVDGTTLYVGGGFTNLNNNGTVIPEADYIAQWSGGTWSALGSNGAGDGALNGYVAALTLDGSGGLYVGGGFTNAGAVPAADYLAKWSASSWSAIGNNGANNGSLNNGVQAIAVSGSNLYVGGYFTNVKDGSTSLPAADLVAKWDGSHWSSLGGNGAGGDGVFCVGCGSSVSTLYVDGTDVYVGGAFNNINSNGVTLDAADRIAKWDGSNWYTLGSDGAGNGSINNRDGRVYAITAMGTDLLVGGMFSNVNNNGAVVSEADYLAAYGMTVSIPDHTPPTVLSITRADPSPTTAATVDFTVTFSEPVYIPWQYSFVVTMNGVNNAAVTGMSGSGSVYTLHVSTGGGNGTIRLDVADDDTIVDAAGNPLGGVGNGNGDFTSGEVYSVGDATAPSVTSIVRFDPNPTNVDTVTFFITFSEAVTGVDVAAPFNDFAVTTSGVSNAAVTSVTGSGKNYTVFVSTGTGSGTLRLDVVDNDTIHDLASNPLGGSGAGNGSFTTGQSYKVRTATFGDVPVDYWSWQFIERLYTAGITGGCLTNPLSYCPETYVNRAQMAVFLLRGKHGSAYAPPAATGTMFADIPADYWAAPWIEELAVEGITGGCGNGEYCPDVAVTRDQMAIFLLRARHGSAYAPPAASGVFGDVPTNFWAASWIEQLSAEGITGGCGGGDYCPTAAVNRAQMAVFLVRAFSLP